MGAGRRRSDVRVTAFGQVWKLRPVPAWDWIIRCDTPDLAHVFPGLVADKDVPDLWQRIGQDDFDRRCANTARSALGKASGREWFWSYNLIAEARKSWVYVNGKLLMNGVGAKDVELTDWLDACYVMLATSYSEDERKALDMRLRRIPASTISVRPRMSSREDLLSFARD